MNELIGKSKHLKLRGKGKCHSGKSFCVPVLVLFKRKTQY